MLGVKNLLWFCRILIIRRRVKKRSNYGVWWRVVRKNTPLYITISIGGYHVACEQAQDIKHILENADQALYRSKREGRNRVSFCDVGSGHSA
ncbi:MAG: GGDEF domain-containing protein [Thiomicrospira sp.]